MGGVGDISDKGGQEAGAITYGDREDQVELRRPRDQNDEDEEAQLLDDEDYDQFELDEVARYSSSEERPSHAGDGRGGETQGARIRTTTKRSAISRIISFLRGPAVSKPYTIRPIFPSVQEAPVRWLDRIFPRPWQKFTLLAIGLVLWTAAFTLLLIRGKGAMADAQGNTVQHMDCVDTFWRRNNECGLDGIDCQPFTNETITFRCPADCAGVRVLNPHHVGPIDVNYQPLVIGGPVYRGDSFVCGSAIHAGVIDDATGGCGTVTLRGSYYSFFSSDQHGIKSIGFDSHFPLSFTLSPAQCGDSPTTGKDPRSILLLISLLSTTLLSLLTTSPPILFFTNFIAIFAHVALASDPIAISGPSPTILPSLISTLTGRLLPSLFVAAILYQTMAKRTLPTTPQTQLEKITFYLLPLWFGALSNTTLSWIPLSRLTAHDLSAQPGAKTALAGIILLIVALLTLQTYHLHREGRVPTYLALYGVILASLLLLIALPSLELRIHHYILALLLLPLTALQTRPSLVYQGFLLGLLINGVARWGFDAVLQTPGALRGDGVFGSLVPETLEPLVYLGDQLGGEVERPWSISFKWAVPVPEQRRWLEGVSVLVNDVERFRGFFNAEEEEEGDMVFAWEREVSEGGLVTTPEYFRFAYVGGEGGRTTLDYSEAGTWFVNGSWSRGAGYYR